MGRVSAADPSPREHLAGRVAAGLVAAEALVLVGVAALYLYLLVLGEGNDLMIVIMSVATIVVFVVGLAYTAKGLWARHPRAQAPAIAANFLLVPLGIAMFQFAPWWLAALVLLVGVSTIAATFLMGRLGAEPAH